MGLFSSIAGIAAPIIGGAIGGSSAPDEITSVTDFPDWLKPYIYQGGAGPNFGAPTPINYNWMDWATGLGQGALPLGGAPPMSMNDPRMSFGNVYTPIQGGPWGYGLGPGPLTAEAGIPGAPGQQFAPPPGGFVPGGTPVPGASSPPPGGGALGLDQIQQAEELQRQWMASTYGEGVPMPLSQALQIGAGGYSPQQTQTALAGQAMNPASLMAALERMGGL